MECTFYCSCCCLYTVLFLHLICSFVQSFGNAIIFVDVVVVFHLEISEHIPYEYVEYFVNVCWLLLYFMFGV